MFQFMPRQITLKKTTMGPGYYQNPSICLHVNKYQQLWNQTPDPTSDDLQN